MSASPGEAEHPLGDDVALDLGRAGVDRLRLRDALSRGGVGTRAMVARERCQLTHRALEAGRLRQSAALEAEDRHRYLPAVARLTDQVAVFDLGSGEEYLRELAAAGHLANAPDLDARLVHVDQEEANALVRFAVGARARKQEALVRVVRAARPGLLPVQHPSAVLVLGTRAQAREVAARVGLAESLAEDQVAAEDPIDVLVLLPLCAVSEQRRREKRHAEPAQDHRRAGASHLLLVDRLHHRRGAAAALFRPAELQPAGLVERALPAALDVLIVVLAVAAYAPVAPLGRQVLVKPRSDLFPEGLLFLREAEIHNSQISRPQGWTGGRV